jgi:DNA-binding NtrC family response regulator
VARPLQIQTVKEAFVRLLVVDSNALLGWQLRHQLAPEVEVELVGDFDSAERRVLEHPPDAAVVSLPPADLPWREFQHLCATRNPPVPVLYESCVHRCPGAAGIDVRDGYAAFLPKPASRQELAAALAALLAESRAGRRKPPPVA